MAWMRSLGLVLTGAARGENIKIGIMVPYSGANADLGAVQDKAFDLYMKLHARDIAPHTVELIKRDEGPPSGANAKTVATELITRDKVSLLLGVGSSRLGDRHGAAGDTSQSAIHHRQCGHRLDHDAVAVHRAVFVQHAA